MLALLGLLTVIVFQRLHRTIFNPVSLFFSSFIATFFFAFLVDRLGQSQPLHASFPASPANIAKYYAMGMGAFLIPWFLAKIRPLKGFRPMQKEVYDICKFKEFTIIWSFLLIITLVACVLLLGSVPIISMLLKNYTIAEHIENIKNLPAGLMAVILISTFMLILHLSSLSVGRKLYGINKRNVVWFAIILSMSAMWQGNRQIFLMIAFFIITRWSLNKIHNNRLSIGREIKKIISFGLVTVLFVLVFTLIGIIRHAATDGGLSLELLYYFSWPVYNMILLQQSDIIGKSNWPNYIFTEILPSRFGGKEKVVEIGHYLFEPTSPSGYFAYWFADYGYAGVIVGALCLSMFCRWSYHRRMKSENYMRIYLLALWCCATAGIYNHFISINYFWLPFAFLIIEQRISGSCFYKEGICRSKSVVPRRTLPLFLPRSSLL